MATKKNPKESLAAQQAMGLALCLLDNDNGNGISEESYIRLLDVLASTGVPATKIYDLKRKVQATDGTFYIKE